MREYIGIDKIYAREILDSRGNPTIEVDVYANGLIGRSSVPSGASTGQFEAHELRDDNKNRYNGKSVQIAVSNVNNLISDKLKGMDIYNQTEIDEAMIELDGTENKSKIGANAILGVSMAVCKVASRNLNIPLYQYLGGISGKNIPTPMMNILNGGRHADNNINIQEFMIVPISNETISEKIRMCSEIYWELKRILKSNNYITSIGDEGGFAPNLSSDEEALDLIMQAINQTGYKNDFGIALDVAASEMYEEHEYNFWKNGESKTTNDMIEYYAELIEKYPIISIEDGLADEDIEGWSMLTKKLGSKVQLVGDDLFTTNVKRLDIGIEKNLANSILIKPNQIGTVTETIDTIRYAKAHGYSSIISHRSGETEDAFIADLAVGLNARYIKSGAPVRGERTSKYNRLIRIEEQL